MQLHPLLKSGRIEFYRYIFLHVPKAPGLSLGKSRKISQRFPTAKKNLFVK
jgi:hypothetical protein